MTLTLKDLIFLIKSDLHRYEGKTNFKIFLKNFILNKGFQLTFWYRLCHHFYMKNNKLLLAFSILFFRTYKEKYGMDFHYKAKIGSGLCLYHAFGTALGPTVVIGKNANILHRVTFANVGRGSKKGAPIIGDNVLLAPGSALIGNIHIGSNSVLAANTVVSIDIPENSVVAGIPGKVISNKGSHGYILNTDYE
ncbi:MAG: serine acetyltransferase [bacterium]